MSLYLVFSMMPVFSQPAGSANVKIYGRRMDCLHASNDDMFEMDGKGDEVYVTYYYSIASSNGTTRSSGKITTPVYGDINNWSSRVKAGSRSAKGGIQSGDMIVMNPSSEPYMPIGDIRFRGLLMIDLNLGADEILTIIPVLWEWDIGTDATQNAFESFIMNSFNNVNVKMAAVAARFNPPMSFIYGVADECFDLNALKQILRGKNDVPGHRPIGMASDGKYTPVVFVLNQKILSQWGNVYGLTDGESQIVFNESGLGNTRDHGDYVLKTNVISTPPVPVKTGPTITRPAGTIKNVTLKDPVINRNINTNQTIPAGSVPKQPATSFTNEFLTGVWKGTMGTLSSATDGPFSFKINNNVYWALDKNGATTAAGSYQLLNGGFTATYYDSNNWKYVFTSTGYNSGTGEVSGNWTCEGPDYYKTGKWIAKKVSN